MHFPIELNNFQFGYTCLALYFYLWNKKVSMPPSPFSPEPGRNMFFLFLLYIPEISAHGTGAAEGRHDWHTQQKNDICWGKNRVDYVYWEKKNVRFCWELCILNTDRIKKFKYDFGMNSNRKFLTTVNFGRHTRIIILSSPMAHKSHWKAVER